MEHVLSFYGGCGGRVNEREDERVGMSDCKHGVKGEHKKAGF